MQLSKNVQACQLSPMRKYHPYAVEAKARGTKIYHLNIGQPDIATPRQYFDAIRAFAHPVVEYMPSQGIPPLIAAVQSYYAGIGASYDLNDIFITTGGSEALQMLMLSILDAGSEVITPEPFYPNYSTFIYAAGGKICPLTTTAEEGYFYADRAKIETLINENTRAILLTNPGNPTGVVLNEEELRMIVEIAKKHDLYLIADEVYREFVYDGQALLSAGQIAGAEDNVVLIDSVSKRFSACGARVGAVLTKNKGLQQALMKFCQARLSVATIDQVAAAALYEADTSYFGSVRDEYKRRRDTCYRKLAEIPGIVCEEPQGAFYMMAKLPLIDADADAFQTWLLTDFSHNGETVMFAPGEGFYETPGLGRDEIRIAYVLNCEDLARAVDLLAMGIQAYNTR